MDKYLQVLEHFFPLIIQQEKKKKKKASNQMLFLDGILSTDFC